MLRNLLIERFGLRAHREMREIPIYVLSIAKSGVKAKASAAPQGIFMGTPIPGGFRNHTERGSTPFDSLVNMLQNRLNSIVIDKTGLTGQYEIDFSDANPIPQPDDPPLPALATALEQDLGLKLEKAKAPYEVVVVDHIERTPTEN
jgi:uncharacterized protein (TIGR03435 family)